MKSLISINNKFMVLKPKDLVSLILKSKYTKGVEAFIDVYNEKELNYLSDLVFELKRNNLVLQIHGDIGLNLDKQIEYMKWLEKYSDYLSIPIVVTLHSIYDENIEISLEKTVEYISKLINSIDNEKIIICLENLNDIKGCIRLDKDEIKMAILNNEKLYFTYDIGHEIVDYGQITNLNKYIFESIRNIHIHSNNNRGIDHMPIYKNDIHWNDIMKGLSFLIHNKYKYNIVYEYGLEYCNGDTIEEKIKDYLYSVDYVSERIDSILNV